MSDPFRNRQVTIQVFFILSALFLIVKAFQLQVFDKDLRNKADAAIISKYIHYPSRGLITDRNNKLLIYNNPAYDLMVTYNQIDPDMDTAKFCRLLGIEKDYFEEALDKNWRSIRYSKFVPFVFLSKITAPVYAAFQESLYEFPGFTIQPRNIRGYPHKSAAHVLGYIREVNKQEVEDSLRSYTLGDYIGASGLELQYEEVLKGDKGSRYVLKDNMGREVGPYRNNQLDIDPIPGKDIITSIDLELQQYGESLMQNKIGSIVAIEPATGEILAMVSSPAYDPNELTITQGRGKAYQKLAQDSLMPFFDRSIMAQYPPGSLFKPVVALIAMQEGLLNPNRTISCGGAYYHNGERLVGCHGHPTCTSVGMAIQHSCNAYFVTVFRDVVDQYGFYNPQKGLDVFNGYLKEFGLGNTLGIDFPREKTGNYPTSKYYDDYFEKQQAGQKWNSLWVRSLGIGQGELLLTNLQMANLAAIIANQGWYYTPHLVKELKDEMGNREMNQAFTKKHEIPIKKEYFQLVVDGMEMVVRAGTARSAFIYDIPVCGKTGTAENNQRGGKDHSIFFAFAPKEDPKIAIAVYVENGGFGGTYAAPIASLMIEKHIKGSILSNRQYLETRMKETNLIEKLP